MRSFATDTIWIRAALQLQKRIYTEALLLDWHRSSSSFERLTGALFEQHNRLNQGWIVLFAEVHWCWIRNRFPKLTQVARQAQTPRQAQVARHQGSLLVLAGEHAPKVLVAWRSTVKHTQHIHLQMEF